MLTAATVFADADWIASDGGMGGKALELVERAQRLAHSPWISDGDRRRIRERVPGRVMGG